MKIKNNVDHKEQVCCKVFDKSCGFVGFMFALWRGFLLPSPMLLSPDLVNRLAPLELKARHIVEGFISGLHKSPFHGYSVEFAEHRPYNAGDELRHIDWKVFAKTERFYVKQYEEETNLRCHVVLDVSSSMDFKYFGALSKREFAVYLASSFFYLMQKQRDASALHVFDETLVESHPCKATDSHLRLLYGRLQHFLQSGGKGADRKTASARVLHELADKIQRRSLVIILSDLFENVDEQSDLLRAMKKLRHMNHEVILFHLVESRSERHFEIDHGRVQLRDLETDRRLEVIPEQVADDYRRKMRDMVDAFRAMCSEVNIDFEEVDTESSFDLALLSYMNKRRRVTR